MTSPISSLQPPVEVQPGVFRLVDRDDPPNVRMLVAHCAFGSDDAVLLVSLLPRLVHVCERERLASLVQFVDG